MLLCGSEGHRRLLSMHTLDGILLSILSLVANDSAVLTVSGRRKSRCRVSKLRGGVR